MKTNSLSMAASRGQNVDELLEEAVDALRREQEEDAKNGGTNQSIEHALSNEPILPQAS